MKKSAVFMFVMLLAAALLLAAAGCASPVSAEASPVSTEPVPQAGSETVFEASGRAVVSVEPDIAFLNVGVNVTGETPQAALAANNELMAAVVEAVKAAGIGAESVQTSDFAIRPQYDYSWPVEKVNGYQAYNRLSIVIKDIGKVAEVLDGAVAAGANDVGQIRFDLADKTAAYDEALALAVENAAAKVKVMAAAAGLDKAPAVRSIVESTYSTYSPYEMRDSGMAEASAMGSPIEAGQLQLTADVVVEFLIAD